MEERRQLNNTVNDVGALRERGIKGQNGKAYRETVVVQQARKPSCWPAVLAQTSSTPVGIFGRSCVAQYASGELAMYDSHRRTLGLHRITLWM